MRVCIVSDSKRGATRRIVHWMVEALEEIEGIEVVTKGPERTEPFDHDLLVLGSPIYFERPMKSMAEFVVTTAYSMHSQRVAVFILGWAKSVYQRAEKHIEKSYFGPLVKGFSDELLSKHMFRGWVLKKDPAQENESKEWILRVVRIVKSEQCDS
ncbi:MAG: hypothetical protein KAJ96_01560 [Candidatus Thorarchaeota archaeon]|nr:hypothetical protein [Candidatus Thorarchaeota archaeon]